MESQEIHILSYHDASCFRGEFEMFQITGPGQTCVRSGRNINAATS